MFSLFFAYLSEDEYLLFAIFVVLIQPIVEGKKDAELYRKTKLLKHFGVFGLSRNLCIEQKTLILKKKSFLKANLAVKALMQKVHAGNSENIEFHLCAERQCKLKLC